MTDSTLSQTIHTTADPDESPHFETAISPASLWKAVSGILAFVAERLTFGILVLLSIIFLSYLGLDMARGTEFGPAVGRAFPRTAAYVGRLLHGDLGLTSAGSKTWLSIPVTQVIAETLPRSLGLLGISLLFAASLGSFLGILAASGRSQRSLGILLSTLVGVSIPSFFAAFLLQLALTTYTRRVGQSLLPVGGFGWDKHLILPMLVLAARPIAQITRIAFVSVRQVLQQDYVRTARGKGLYPLQVMAIHVIRNAAIPILTTIGVSLRFSLSSLPVVEFYFGWPGVGLMLLKGIAQQDDNLTVALSLCLGILFILVNLILELSYRFIDPRLWETPAHIASDKRQRPLEAIKAKLDDFVDLLTDNAITGWFKQRRARSHANAEGVPGSFHGVQAEDETTSTLANGKKSTLRAVLGNFPLTVGGLLVLGLVVVVFFGPRLTPTNPYRMQGLMQIDGKFNTPPFVPSQMFPWGTDVLGRGMMSLILAGAQQTLILAVMAVSARTVVGVVLGAIAGWTTGSRLDRLILGTAEVVSAFPTLLLAMILILALGIRQGMPPFVIALCFVGWGEIMQFVRSEVIAIRPQPYIESAVSVGARTPRIISRHVLPNLLSALISIVALEMGAVLMLLGELGFISIFIGGGAVMLTPGGKVHYSDVPEWGALLSNLRYQARSYPWTALYPMAAFFTAILSFNLFGEGFRRLVDQGNLIINRIVNRYTVTLTMVALVGLNWLSGNSGALAYYRQQAQEFDGDQALGHVTALTDPSFYGRALGTPGIDLAAEYIANEFEAMGVQIGGRENTYFQECSRGFMNLETIPLFAIEDGGPSPIYGKDYAAYAGLYAVNGEASSPVRFIAMGQQGGTNISSGWRTTYPELDRADFSGEVLLLLSDREAEYLSRRVPKDGMLVVTDDPDQLMRRFTIGSRGLYGGETLPPWLWISEETADRLLAGSEYTIAELREKSAELDMEQVFEMGLQTRVRVKVEGTLEERWPVQNVIGYLPGIYGYDRCADCLDTELIVVMAQYDTPPPDTEGIIYPAANNNASGVAVMLEAIRVMQETDYEPYRSFLFVAYSGEGLEGGESVSDPDVTRFLQAQPGFTNFKLEAIVKLRGVGGGTGDRLGISAGGSLRLAELFEKTAKRTGVTTVRADETIDISVIYEGESMLSGVQEGQKAPTVRLFWEGWDEHSRLSTDTLANISVDSLEETGRTLALSLMILGREREY
ncbi:MAG: ABC transporter permease subunit [Chloroflexi bacterium]|nr:ABC transporter permease subunit [Chloroflexota bacterium]